MFIKNNTQNSFLSIKTESKGYFKDKGSKFLSFAFPVKTVEESLSIIKQKRKEFYDATHICYAYMLGNERNTFRINDDGEPSGTAGKPILGQINSKVLTNILVIVVRYFGGILLGTSGLINAYKNAASEVLNNAEIVEIAIEKQLKITCGYDDLNFIIRLIKDLEVKVIHQNMSVNCEFTVICKQIFYENLLSKLQNNSSIKLTTFL